MNTFLFKWTALISLLLLSGIQVAQAETPALQVGRPAPQLQVAEWVQGGPIKEFDRDKVYLVEFWATWCGPCLTTIPHLNELHTKYKDQGLVVIGQNVFERDPKLVAPFVKKMGAKMTYPVALDLVNEDGEGRMAITWMKAAGRNGIPSAFLVNQDGDVVWIGHPMSLKQDMLEKVLARKFDLATAVAAAEKEQKEQAQMQKLWGEFQQHVGKQEWNKAEANLAEIENLVPENDRGNIQLRRFRLKLDQKDFDAASKVAAEISRAHAENAMLLNEVAWAIAILENPRDHDLQLAEKIARRADHVTKSENPEILDTLARILFLQGQKQPAIELQEKAVEYAKAQRKEEFQRTLNGYKAGRVVNLGAVSRARHQFENHLREMNWAEAESVLSELETLLGKEDAADLDRERFRLLLGKKEYANAWKVLNESDKPAPMMMNQLAWEIAVGPDPTPIKLELAEQIARKANELTGGTNAEILDTLARVLFLKGEREPAQKLQEKAVSFATGARKKQFQATLDSYKRGELAAAY